MVDIATYAAMDRLRGRLSARPTRICSQTPLGGGLQAGGVDNHQALWVGSPAHRPGTPPPSAWGPVLATPEPGPPSASLQHRFVHVLARRRARNEAPTKS